jgi:methyl-accepting chemotaxis protein
MNKQLKNKKIIINSSKTFKNKFLNLSFKNMTIIRSFTNICVISVLAIFIIGLLSFFTINDTHNNVRLMYTRCLERQMLLSSVNVHLNVLRNNIPNQLEYPKESFKNVIKKEIDGISEDLDEYKSLALTSGDEQVEKLFSDLKNSCNDIVKIQNGEVLDNQTKNMYKDNFETNQYKFSNGIFSSVTQNKADAEKLFNEINKSYNNSIISFIVVFIISIIIIFIITAVVIKILKKSIYSFNKILNTLAFGDFTIDIETNEKSEIGMMKKELAATINSIAVILKAIRDGGELTLKKAQLLAGVSKEMDSTMQEVAGAVNEIADGASVQSSELIVMGNVFSKLDDEIIRICSSIKDVDKNTKSVNIMAQGSNNELTELIETINTISSSFDSASEKIEYLGLKVSEINKITDVINGIAEETNLLSLNASIEAARSGEAGRGFAVVAEEIRKLAEQSRKSSDEINRLIKDISIETNNVVNTTHGVNKDLKEQIDIIENSVGNFKKIISSINGILPKIEEISFTAQEISKSKEEIVKSIKSTASIAEKNSASSEEIAASTQEVTISADSLANTAQLLADNSNVLIKQVNNFKLKQ